MDESNRQSRRRSSSLAHAALPHSISVSKNSEKKQKLPSSSVIAERDEHDHNKGFSDQESDVSLSSNAELDHITSDDEVAVDEETGLNDRDRRKRRKRRRRHTRMDQRIVEESKTTKQEEEKAALQSVIRASFVNAILIGLWYLFSVSISVVGHQRLPMASGCMLTKHSTTNGCSLATV